MYDFTMSHGLWGKICRLLDRALLLRNVGVFVKHIYRLFFLLLFSEVVS